MSSRVNGQITSGDVAISYKKRNVKMAPSGALLVPAQTGNVCALGAYDDAVPVDSTISAVTINLPPAFGPQAAKFGDVHTIVDAGGNASAHNITIVASGCTIKSDGASAASSIVINTNYGQRTLTFYGSTVGWVATNAGFSPVSGNLINGGNSGAVVAGSTDNSLALIANGATRATFSATGVVGITSAAAQDLTVVAGVGGTATIGVSAGAFLALPASGAVTLGTIAGGSIVIGSGGNAVTVTVGSTNGASATSIRAGSGGLVVGSTGADSPTTIQAGVTFGLALNVGAASLTMTPASIALNGAAGGAIGIGNAAVATTVSIGTGAAAIATTIGSTNTTSQTSILSGTAGISIVTATTGAVNIDSGTTGAINIGVGANAKTITIGNATGATAVAIGAGTGGVFIVATGVGNVTLHPGATGNVQLNASGNATCGVQLGIPVPVTDKAAGGSIGTAVTTVDIASVIEVNQTTAGQTLTVPSPTLTAQARLLYVLNIGAVAFTLLGSTLAANGAGAKSMTCLIWSPGGNRWVPPVIT